MSPATNIEENPSEGSDGDRIDHEEGALNRMQRQGGMGSESITKKVLCTCSQDRGEMGSESATKKVTQRGRMGTAARTGAGTGRLRTRNWKRSGALGRGSWGPYGSR